MNISTGLSSPRNYRAAEIVSNIDLGCLSERGRLDSKTGKSHRGQAYVNQQVLAVFRSQASADMTVDKVSGEVLSYTEQIGGTRSSFLYGGTFSKTTQKLRVKDGVKEYVVRTRQFDRTTAVDKTETVRDTDKGIQSFQETQHIDGSMERFYRANPSVRKLVMMAGGGAIGGLGTFLATGSPLAAALGACTAATIASTVAHSRPSNPGAKGALEMATYLPVSALELGVGLGTTAAVLAVMVRGS